jgi:ABC-2 type transport system ATP-binding protein
MPVVEVRNLQVWFGKVHAVQGIDLIAEPGRVTALLGRNGAGKSTTMRVLAGVVPPSSGEVQVCGFDVRRELLDVKQAIAYCPDIGGLVPRATPWEHLQLVAKIRRMTEWEDHARDLLERFELAGEAHRVTAGFSHGMGRRLSVLLAVFAQPRVLLLDEPFDGVDPLGVETTMIEIQAARACGAAVLLSTHLRDLATEVADEAIVLRGGAKVATLPADELSGATGGEIYRGLLA